MPIFRWEKFCRKDNLFEELDGVLIAQDLITGVEECSDQEALRLLAMELLTEEMVAISLLEKRFASSSLSEVLARRGWLSKELYEAIFQEGH